MRKGLLTLVSVVLLCFIWGNSLLPAGASNKLSDTVVEVVGGQITHTTGEEREAPTWLTSGRVRKLAHMAEFAGLGAAAILCVVSRGGQVRRKLSGIALFGLTVAVVDETIQLFTGRTSAVKDIWIDSAGFAVGCCLAWAAAYMLVLRRRGRG